MKIVEHVYQLLGWHCSGMVSDVAGYKVVGLASINHHRVVTSWMYTPWAVKNVALYFCPYLRQLLIDFHNSFTELSADNLL